MSDFSFTLIKMLKKKKKEESQTPNGELTNFECLKPSVTTTLREESEAYIFISSAKRCRIQIAVYSFCRRIKEKRASGTPSQKLLSLTRETLNHFVHSGLTKRTHTVFVR